MKVSEVDFGSYEYVRIAVLRRIGPEYCAAHAEDYVKRTYGEMELSEENAVTCADGWGKRLISDIYWICGTSRITRWGIVWCTILRRS